MIGGLLLYSIAQLYQWRYKNLGNLPHVMEQLEYKLANPGFAFDYQLINVDNYNGVGESEPSPYFFQVRNCNSLSHLKTALLTL